MLNLNTTLVLKYVSAILLLFSIFLNKLTAQSIVDIEREFKTYTTPVVNLKYPKLPDPVVGLSLDKEDLPELQKHIAKAGDVKYVKLKFNSEEDLKQLFGVIKLLPKVKYLEFDEWRFGRDTVKPTVNLPDDFLECKSIVAIKFLGNTKIRLDDAFEKFTQSDQLAFLDFTLLPLQRIPSSITQLTKLSGLKLYAADSAIPSWLSSMVGLKSISISAEKGDVTLILKSIATLKNIKSLKLEYLTIAKDFFTDIRLLGIEDLYVNTAFIHNASSFFKIFCGPNLKKIQIQLGRMNEIPETTGKATNLNFLEVSNNQKTLLVSGAINKLKKVKTINLSGDSIAGFPGKLELPHLEKLDISYNQLTLLPPGITELPKLRELDIRSNKLKELPKDLNRLKKLEKLNGSSNPLIMLPSMGGMSNLEWMDFSYCNLKELPADIGNLKALRELVLLDNFIKKLPAGFTRLTQLKNLKLNINQIESLPEDIGKMAALEELTLGLNCISKLPQSITQLKNLKSLVLANNSLKEIPDSIGRLIALESFDVGNNMKGYSNRSIYRPDNSQTDRVALMNTIHRLPIDLRGWKNIKTIYLSSNDLSKDSSLFTAFFSIPSIGYSLNLENCSISYLPEAGWDSFGGRSLELRNNAIATLPVDMAKAKFLENLNFSKNKLPLKPVNLNAFAENKHEVLVYFAEAGMIKFDQLPKTDSMVNALLSKGDQYYLYQKNYQRNVEMVKYANAINSEITSQRLNNRAVGESKFHIGDYEGAILNLTNAIQNDTAGQLRIMNHVIPDFEYRAKSYLALKDTTRAIGDYRILAEKFESSYWGNVGVLYQKVKDPAQAGEAFCNGINAYEHRIEWIKKAKQSAQMEQLCVLELYIIAEDFKKATTYARSIKNDIVSQDLLPIYKYLLACLEIIENGQEATTAFSPAQYKNMVSSSWGYDLFLEWLQWTGLQTKTVKALHFLTIEMKNINE